MAFPFESKHGLLSFERPVMRSVQCESSLAPPSLVRAVSNSASAFDQFCDTAQPQSLKGLPMVMGQPEMPLAHTKGLLDCHIAVKPERLVLPPVPFIVAQSCIICDCDPEQAFARLQTVLNEDISVDCAADRAGARICGVVVRAAQAVKFHVNFFRDENFRVVVEFQRRRGDAWCFNTFFRETVGQLEDLTATRVPELQSIAAPFSSVDEERGAQPVPEALLAMATSTLVDVAREGAVALAQLSSSANMTSDPRVWAAVKQLIDSSDAEVQRCGATVLANMTASELARNIVGLLPRLAQLLSAPTPASLECDTARQIARALNTCAAADAKALRQDFLLQVMHQRSHSSDRRLSEPIAAALDCIYSC